MCESEMHPEFLTRWCRQCASNDDEDVKEATTTIRSQKLTAVSVKMNSSHPHLPPSHERHDIIMISSTSTQRIGDTTMVEQTARPSRRILAAPHISYGALSERTPFVRHSSRTKRSYWHPREYTAFRRRSTTDSFSKDASYLQRVSDRLRLVRKNHPTMSPLLLEGSWKILLVLSLCLAVSCYHLRREEDTYSKPEWKWDRNVYNPRQPVGSNVSSSSSSSSSSVIAPGPQQERNLLLAQFSGSPALDILSSISSRPNRAYARQWVRDYVRYTGSSSKRLERACFDKVYLLRTILNRQAHTETLWSPSSRVEYDVVVLLPPDAIITDLDSDLLNLFPADKLFGVASYQQQSTSDSSGSTYSEVLFFNLRHKYAVDTAELWYSLTEPPVTCGAGNDIQLLLEAVRSVAESEDEVKNDLVATLAVSPKGFVGSRSIKVIPQTVPSSKAVTLVSNAAKTKLDLQTTADSVCYRYYPRCDVL